MMLGATKKPCRVEGTGPCTANAPNIVLFHSTRGGKGWHAGWVRARVGGGVVRGSGGGLACFAGSWAGRRTPLRRVAVGGHWQGHDGPPRAEHERQDALPGVASCTVTAMGTHLKTEQLWCVCVCVE